MHTDAGISGKRADNRPALQRALAAAGKMVFRMLAVLAEFERDLVSERTTAAMAVMRSNGQRVGTVPFGFTLDVDGATLSPDDAEQSVIADIREMRGRGLTLQRIAAELTERRVATKTGKSARWTHQAVARILSRQRAAS